MNIKKLVLKYQEKIFPFLDIGLNGVNYLFHVFCSWYVTQQDYGTLNALLSILAVLLVTGISFQTYTAKEVSQNGVTAKRIYKVAFVFVAILSIIFLILIDHLLNFTRSSYISLALLFLVFFLNLFLSILRGIFQGEKQFFNLNMNFYIEVLSKVFFIVILLPRYKSINIVLLSLVFGMAAGIIHGILKLKIGTLIVRNQDKIVPVAKSLGIIYLSNFFIYYCTSIDMVIFNYKLHEISGIYAVVLRYSQIILFVSFSLITIFIPNLSFDVKNKSKFNFKVKKYFALLVGIQFILLIIYKTILPISVGYLFGAKYLEAAKYLFMGSIMYCMLVNSFYLINVNIILERRLYILSLGSVAILYTLFLLKYGTDIILFLKGGIFFYTILFLLLVITFIFEEINTMEKNMKNYKKKILFLSWRDIKAPKKGGAEIFTHEMIKRLDHTKYEITHFSPAFSGGEREETIDGIKYIRDGGSLSVILRAKQFYTKNKNKFDYVVDQCNTHRFFTKFWVEKEKRIFFIHQLTREIWDMNSSFPTNFIGRVTETPFLRLSKADPTITVSQSTKDDLINIGFEEKKVTILPEGIDFKPWNTDDFLPKEADPTFIYVGRYSNYKGIDKAVEAFCILKSKYPKAKLWVVGKKKEEYIKTVLEPLVEKYDSKEKKIGDDITYWGFVSEEKKLELMSRSHCLLFPSLREGWGLIITESAAVGTPSIGFNSAGIRDALKKGEAGYLCNSNTVEELIYQMESVIEDKEKYDLMRDAAYKFSLNFHWENTKNEFNNFMEGLEENR